MEKKDWVTFIGLALLVLAAFFLTGCASLGSLSPNANVPWNQTIIIVNSTDYDILIDQNGSLVEHPSPKAQEEAKKIEIQIQKKQDLMARIKKGVKGKKKSDTVTIGIKTSTATITNTETTTTTVRALQDYMSGLKKEVKSLKKEVRVLRGTFFTRPKMEPRFFKRLESWTLGVRNHSQNSVTTDIGVAAYKKSGKEYKPVGVASRSFNIPGGNSVDSKRWIVQNSDLSR